MTGAELRERREALGLTPEQLAEKFRCEADMITIWEDPEGVEACCAYPGLLDLAMDELEYEANAMSDEEFAALRARAVEAVARANRLAGGA